MKKFEIFSFEKFSFDPKTLEARFYYSFDHGNQVFEEVINFSCKGFTLDEQICGGSSSDYVLQNYLFQLHLALGISYYKLYPTKKLQVKSGYIDEAQKKFWHTFYKNGLGEFFVKNSVDPTHLLQFENSGYSQSIGQHSIIQNYISSSKNFLEKKSLLLWGGGKDSIVSYGLLQEKKEFDLFVFGKVDDIKRKTAEVAGKDILLVQRQLSRNLFKLNEEGYYNGHVPITGIIAFVTFVVGYLYGYSNIILSNEQSASEGNTTWKGVEVNHQYSKSFEFEMDLLDYARNYMTQGISYFSLLRGMYEYKIAEKFSKQEKFFKYFSSCNRNFVITKEKQRALWCGTCEKCCFVFLILSAFLDERKLLEIFGHNLFENKDLEVTFRELLGLEHYKPFECVGTYEECLLAAKKTLEKYGEHLPVVLESMKKDIVEKCPKNAEKELEHKLLSLGKKTIIPEEFNPLLK